MVFISKYLEKHWPGYAKEVRDVTGRGNSFFVHGASANADTGLQILDETRQLRRKVNELATQIDAASREAAKTYLETETQELDTQAQNVRRARDELSAVIDLVYAALEDAGNRATLAHIKRKLESAELGLGRITIDDLLKRYGAPERRSAF